MENATTKERILKEALALFAEKGFEAVSVACIAKAVGIKAPSLYKHYKSKQDILDSVLVKMEQRYKAQVSSMEMNGKEADKDAGLFSMMKEEQLLEMGKNLFLYFLHDEYVSKFRRMLIIEQFQSKRMSEIYLEQYIDEPLSYQGMMFGLLTQAGILKTVQPKIMALQFYGPIYLLLNLCDSQPQREAEALEMIEQHICQFNKVYCV